MTTPNSTTEAGVTETETLCPKCEGSGEMMCSTSHLGPDDYDFTCSCDACNGTGSGDLIEIIESLGYWKHKTDIERTLIERSAVLQILKLAASRPSAQGGERVDLRGVDGGDVSEWQHLIKGGYVPKDTVLIRAADAHLAVTPLEQRGMRATPPATSGMKEAACDCQTSNVCQKQPNCRVNLAMKAAFRNPGVEIEIFPPPGESLAGDAERAEIPNYTIKVDMGGGAAMFIPNPVTDPHIGYSLRYSGNLNATRAGRFSAAALIDSYDYIVSDEISLKEVVRRLSLMRNARRAAIRAGRKEAGQ